MLQPSYFADGNSFLANFVNHEFLATLGVIVSITLASCANLHLELNKLQEITGARFQGARKAVKRSAYSLIWSLGIAFALVIFKPLLVAGAIIGSEWINSLAVLLFFFNLSILTDITKTVFKVPVLSHVQPGVRDETRVRSEPRLH
jgi:uncharacterized BrkB/YihY/UPF0761 family membrane protein